jgi:hypothetical protein
LTEPSVCRATNEGGEVSIIDSILSIAQSQRGKPYRVGGNWTAADANPPYFDCSELAEWVCLRAGVPLRLAETTYLQYWQCKDARRVVPVAQGIATRGALLFTFTSAQGPIEPPRDVASAERVLVRRHVMFSLGGGRAFGAMNAQLGTREVNDLSKVTHAALIPGVDYSGHPPSGGPATRFRQRPDKPWLRRGSVGAAVKEAQSLLIKAGAPVLQTYGPTGNFYDVTLRAVKAFQLRVQSEQHVHMVIDGVIGPVTWGWLLAYAG